MLLAQISDMHVVVGRRLLGRIDTAGCLERAVSHLNRLRPQPDFVLATGDLVDDSSLEAYRLLRRMLDELAMPYAVMPGNHDDRERLREIFGDQTPFAPDGEFLQFTLENLPLRILALDTIVPGDEAGVLCAERLAWLAGRLAEQPERPTLIAMHHPPFVSGIEAMDSINCANSAALGDVVSRHLNIERIICGHIHRPITVRWYGTVVTSAPSTAHQVFLDFTPEAPVKWIAEPPACHLHYWQPATGLATHLSYIGDFGGPQGFD